MATAQLDSWLISWLLTLAREANARLRLTAVKASSISAGSTRRMISTLSAGCAREGVTSSAVVVELTLRSRKNVEKRALFLQTFDGTDRQPRRGEG